jgi:hypothetical protein
MPGPNGQRQPQEQIDRELAEARREWLKEQHRLAPMRAALDWVAAQQGAAPASGGTSGESGGQDPA